RRKGRAAFLVALAFLVAIVGTGGVFGAAWIEQRLRPQDYTGAGTGSVTIQIKEGDSGGNIAQTLVSNGVIKGTEAFVAELAKNPKAASIQPGFYQLRKQMSSAAAVALLLDPKSRAGNQIIIPEGLRAVQVAARLAEKTGVPESDFKKVIKNPDNLGLPKYAKGKVEGFLFPGQYSLPPKGTAEQLLKMMVDRYHQVVRQMDLEARAEQADLKPLDVIIMASLIQSESGKPSDMPKISRVIYNRLERDPPMFLKFDSTTLYGLNKFGIVASSQDVRSKSRYNTYNYPGLPIGAISNPGQEAIDAVFKPADGTWLFFVTTDPKNKITEYATTESHFNRLRAKLNAYLARNGGN
ncbi:endolytic transglycosylase MltG, partial [Actinomadura adrarensis]